MRDALSMDEITSRTRILDATADLLRTSGLKGTKLSEVAKRAGMLAPSLYHHFTSKDELIEEVLVEGCHRNTRYIMTRVERLGEAALPLERIEAAITAHLEFLLTGDQYSSAVSRVFPDLPEQIKRRVLAAYAGFDNYWRDLILAARASGDARSDLDPTVARKLLINMLDSAAEWYRPGHLEIAEIARQACRLFLHGFAQPRP
jgi:TetR/AcrR family transcriptional regulator, cholesterol catabolism regulator